jgi:hypothetical protein
MPLLLYCVTQSNREIRSTSRGLGSAQVEHLDCSGLRCFFSRHADSIGNGSAARDAALAFHRVVRQMFQHAAVIPFRFPTFLADETAVNELLANESESYQATLERLRDKVQVEIRIAYCQEVKGAIPAQSGVAYLQRRRERLQSLETSVERFRQAADGLSRGWKQLDTRTGMRCFALVDRQNINAFMQRITSVEIPSEMEARVTGPWPATEFLKVDQ